MDSESEYNHTSTESGESEESDGSEDEEGSQQGAGEDVAEGVSKVFISYAVFKTIKICPRLILLQK